MLTRIRSAGLLHYLHNLTANARSVVSENVKRQAAGLVFLAWTAFVLGKYVWGVAVDPPPSMRAAVVPYPHLWLLMILAVIGGVGTAALFVHTWGRPVAARWRHTRNALGVAALAASVLGLRYHPGDSALESLLDLAADDSMLLSGSALLLALSLATFFLVRRLLGLQAPKVSLRLVVAVVGGSFLVITVLARAVLPVLGLLWICLAGWLIGDAILARFFPVKHLPSHEQTLLALGLGLGALAQALFFVGIAGLLYKWPILTGLAAITLLRWRRIAQAMQSLRTAWHDLDQQLRIDGVIAILGGLTLVVAVVNFIAALAPEVQSDAIGVHLALPKLWIQTHRLQTLDRVNLTYWTMHNLDVLYALGMLVHSATVAKLLHYGFGLLDLALIYVLGRRIADRRAGALAAVVFYSTSIVWWESGTAYVDLAYTFYTLAAVLSLLLWLDTGQRRLLVLAGIMGGLGAGVKVLGGLVFIPAAIVVVLYHLRRPGLRFQVLVVDEMVLGGAGLLSNATWLALAELNGGPNRLLPTLARLLRLSTQVDQAPIAPGTAHFGMGTDWMSLLRLPWTLTFQPQRFGEVGGVGLALLALGIALLLRSRMRGREGYLLVICLGLSYLWAVTRQNIRYALPIIALWSILVTVAFRRVVDGVPRGLMTGVIQWGAVAPIAVSAVMGFQIWNYTGQSSPGFPYRVVFGLESEKEYLSRQYPIYDSIDYINRAYGKEAHVLAPFNRDNFYPQFVLASSAHATLGPYIGELLQLHSPTALRQALGAKGFTHLILDQAAAYRMAPLSEQRQGTLLDTEWLDQALSLEFAARGMYVYRVPAAGEPLTQPVMSSNRLTNSGFEQNSNPAAWQRQGTPHIDRTATTAHTGSAAAQVDRQNRLFQQVPVEPAHFYQMSLYARQADPGARGRLPIEWLDEAGRVVQEGYVPFVAEEAYTRHSLTEVAPADAAYAVVYVSGLDERDIWVDDVAFVERKSAK